MSLNHELNTILDLLGNRSIIDRDRLLTMMRNLNFDERLIEDITSDDITIQDVIDELLNQSLIWVDDETLQGDIFSLKMLILANIMITNLKSVSHSKPF